MSVQNKDTLKSYFETGDQPTQSNFEDLIDSMFNLSESLSWKQSVVAATTANITLSGNQTIDGVAVVDDDRVLVKNQSTATENGIYVVASGAWSRADDNNTGVEIANTNVFCEGGVANAGTQWNCSETSITLGSTNVTFVKIAGAGAYVAGTGLTLTGNSFSIDSTVVTLDDAQTLTNKTLTAPAISSPTGIVKGDVGLGNVDNTSDATKNAATATLTNKTLTSPVINIGSDATGDLYYRDSGGNFVRLPIGTSGQVLKGGTVPSFDTIAAILGFTPVNVNGDTMTGLLLLSGDPSNALGAATKSYVDNLVSGLTWKNSVVAATTANITLSGTQTIDGVAVIADDRVLVKNQSTATENGIYVVAAGAWSRAADNNTGAEIASTTVLCEAGTVNGGSQWNCSNSSITLGSTNITFAQIAGAGVYTNGTGISLAGNVFSIDSTVATLTGTQTMTNKTLTSPKINVGSDATGDLYYRDSSGNFVRLAVGTSSQVLKGGTTPSYGSVASALGFTPVNLAGDTMTGALVLNADPSVTLGAATKGYVDTAVSGRGVPIGASIEYCGTSDLNPDPDTGAVFLLEDGRAISRTTYATLFSRIGTAYGAGNGTTTFNIPNSAGRFTAGYDNTSDFNAMGKTDGSKTRTLVANNLPVSPPWALSQTPHTHGVTSSFSKDDNVGSSGGFGSSASDWTHAANYSISINTANANISLLNNTGGGQSFGILPPYLVKNRLIRVL